MKKSSFSIYIAGYSSVSFMIHIKKKVVNVEHKRLQNEFALLLY